MINLQEHIVEIEGKNYIPLEIAQKAIVENNKIVETLPELEKSMLDLRKAMEDMDLSILKELND